MQVRVDALTDAQAAHLRCGFYFFYFRGEIDHFRDEAHRRRAWALHRADILEGWDRPGHRPVAFWQYDMALEPHPGPQEWSWPKPIQGEAEMVYRLLEAGEIEGCHLNGLVSIASELRHIEHAWLHEIQIHLGSARTAPLTIKEPLPTWGCPPWFYRQHVRAIIAELGTAA